jgi:hypothetical protein
MPADRLTKHFRERKEAEGVTSNGFSPTRTHKLTHGWIESISEIPV